MLGRVESTGGRGESPLARLSWQAPLRGTRAHGRERIDSIAMAIHADTSEAGVIEVICHQFRSGQAILARQGLALTGPT